MTRSGFTLSHFTRKALLVRIESIGKFLPSRVVTADEADQLAGKPPGWTLQHTGVAERRFVGDETAAWLGAGALRDAMNADSEGSPGRLPDLLISAGGTPQQLIPCTAALIAREMGWDGISCFDVDATCLGFIAALDVAAALLVAERHERIAIVCAEIASKGLNWAEPEAAALMGDGAAAVILSRGQSAESTGSSEQSAILSLALETWPEGAHLTEIRGGGSFLPATQHVPGMNTAEFQFHMDGPGVFRLATERMEPFVSRLIGHGADRWDEIDVVIPHQASPLAMRHLRRKLGIPQEKFVEIASDHGNVIAASLPMALHEAIMKCRLVRGQTALLLGTSAGMSVGGALIRY